MSKRTKIAASPAVQGPLPIVPASRLWRTQFIAPIVSEYATEFENLGPLSLVSKDVAAQYKRATEARCARQTGGGARCGVPAMLSGCRFYCTQPRACLAWLSPLLYAISQVRSIRISSKQRGVIDTVDVDLPAHVRFYVQWTEQHDRNSSYTTELPSVGTEQGLRQISSELCSKLQKTRTGFLSPSTGLEMDVWWEGPDVPIVFRVATMKTEFLDARGAVLDLDLGYPTDNLHYRRNLLKPEKSFATKTVSREPQKEAAAASPAPKSSFPHAFESPAPVEPQPLPGSFIDQEDFSDWVEPVYGAIAEGEDLGVWPDEGVRELDWPDDGREELEGPDDGGGQFDWPL